MYMSFHSNMIDWLVFNVQWAIFQLYSGRNSNMTGVTSGAGTVYPSDASEFTQVFCVVRVAQSLVFCVLFCGSLFTYQVFLLSLELSALRRFTDSDHPFGIFIFFLLSRNIRHWLVGFCFHIKVYEWVLFNVKRAICQLHHGENKLILMILVWWS